MTKDLYLGRLFIQRNSKLRVIYGDPVDKERRRESQLSRVKRKSKFEDAPNINNDAPTINNDAIQILGKPTIGIHLLNKSGGGISIQQGDNYKGFVPPQYQTQDYSDHQNYNSALYQPVQELPSMTQSEHYKQIWDEYRKNVSNGPQYTSHSSYLHHQQQYQNMYAPPPYPVPGGHAYGQSVYPPPPAPYPIEQNPRVDSSRKSRWSSKNYTS